MNDHSGQPKHARLTRDLAEKILSGEYAAGHRLPVEADLIDTFQVSRTALREGLRTLAAKGLVVSRKKLGTLVTAPDQWNLLDADVLSWMGKSSFNTNFLRQLGEARLIFEPEAARLAARRATASHVARTEAAFRAMETAETDEDRINADLAFHVSILEASQNYVLENLGATIGAALRASFEISDQAASNYENTLALHGAVLRAIRRQDEADARERMFELLNKSHSDLGLTDDAEETRQPAVSR